ncbi:MAG: class I SAM-dependent methyltransferase [Candidatus Acidiferrales bacterium]
MGRHYGEDYDRAIARASQNSRHWIGRRDTLLRHKSGGAILDLGCGSGSFLSTLQVPLWKLHGIEMSGPMASEAEAKTGAWVFVGDILDAPFPPQSFNVITCFHVFEHLYQPREVLAKVAEWLKPGGIFFTMMPNIDSAGALIFGSYWYALELPRHLYHFSPKSLRMLASDAGLEEVMLLSGREVFIESSIRYFFDEMFRKAGIRRTPLAKAKPPTLLWRVVRKIFRLTILPVLTLLASAAGDGETIHAIFRKSTPAAQENQSSMAALQDVSQELGNETGAR